MSVTYVPLTTPPNLDAPTGLALAWTADGLLAITVVQPTQPTLRYTYVQVDLGPSPDWDECIVAVIPLGYTGTAIAGLPGGTLVTARAWAADAVGTVSVLTDEVSLTTGAVSGGDTIWQAVVTGDDTFVWLDGELVYEKKAV